MHGTLDMDRRLKSVTFSPQLSAFNHLTTIHFNKNFNYMALAPSSSLFVAEVSRDR